MNAPTFQLMYQLWHTKGAKLSSERVNGHDREQTVVRFREAHKSTSLIENFKQAESDQDE